MCLRLLCSQQACKQAAEAGVAGAATKAPKKAATAANSRPVSLQLGAADDAWQRYCHLVRPSQCSCQPGGLLLSAVRASHLGADARGECVTQSSFHMGARAERRTKNDNKQEHGRAVDSCVLRDGAGEVAAAAVIETAADTPPVRCRGAEHALLSSSCHPAAPCRVSTTRDSPHHECRCAAV